MTRFKGRVRMFAGPNGSGKSTLRDELRNEWIGIYVNADEIEKIYRRDGALDLATFDLRHRLGGLGERLSHFLRESTLLKKVGATAIAEQVTVDGSRILVDRAGVDSYVAAVTADFIRRELLDAGLSFSFETVMSYHDKVDFMREARARGLRTYLYFVATDDPQINVDRVRLRVMEGGHHVAEHHVRERYGRSIALLEQACAASSRAFIFDNSDDKHRLIAQIADGDTLQLHAATLPRWFTQTSLWQSFQPGRAS